jgi:RNA polymerase sigma-70 factor, ECF subfamily
LELKKKLRDKHHQLLLLLARKGNEDAFQRLYREIYDPVAAYVNRRVVNSADAEDIIADVFGKFLMRLDRYDGVKGSVLTWIVSMARHAVIDHHRRVSPATVDSDEMAELLAGQRPGALQALIQEEDLHRVLALLQKQPPLIREMFDLRFGQGLRVKEVAVVVGISQDAAKQRFARTLKQFQVELTDEKNNSRSRKGESPWVVMD